MLKKFLLLTLSIALILTAFPCEYDAAEENSTVTMLNDEEVREMLREKAVEAFPEYEKEIRGENEIDLGKARSGGLGEVVICETRRLSDEEIVTFTQYDSGIATTALGLAAGKNIVDTDPQNSYTQYIMNIWLMCGNSSSTLFVQDVAFRINHNTYDTILDYGDFPDRICSTISTMIEDKRKTETGSTTPAFAQYGGYFEFSINVGDLEMPYTMYARLRLEVGNNTYTLSSSY